MTHKIIHERRGENEVKKFAEAMIEKLNEPKNLAKGGWEDCDIQYLLERTREELFELREEIGRWQWCKRNGMNLDSINFRAKQILKEAADVANFAMMIADKVGALK